MSNYKRNPEPGKRAIRMALGRAEAAGLATLDDLAEYLSEVENLAPAAGYRIVRDTVDPLQEGDLVVIRRWDVTRDKRTGEERAADVHQLVSRIDPHRGPVTVRSITNGYPRRVSVTPLVKVRLV